MLLNKSNGPFFFFLNTARLFHYYYPKQLQNTDYSCFSTKTTLFMPPSKFENDQCHSLTFANWALF